MLVLACLPACMHLHTVRPFSNTKWCVCSDVKGMLRSQWCVCSDVTYPESSVVAETRCCLVECAPSRMLTFPSLPWKLQHQPMHAPKTSCPVSLCLCCTSGARCEDAQAWRFPQVPLLQHLLCQQAVQVGESEPCLRDCLYFRLTVATQCEPYCRSGVTHYLVWQPTLSQLEHPVLCPSHVACLLVTK